MKLACGFEGRGCDRGLCSSCQLLRHRGATRLRRGKGGDSCARPRAEGMLYQRRGGEGKGERRGGREVGVEERPGCCKTRISFECCSSVCSKA